MLQKLSLCDRQYINGRCWQLKNTKNTIKVVALEDSSNQLALEYDVMIYSIDIIKFVISSQNYWTAGFDNGQRSTYDFALFIFC